MNCTKCGKTISNESKFCRFCGYGQRDSLLTGKQVEGFTEPEQDSAKQVVYASFWVRLMAYFVDFALVIVIFSALFLILGDEFYNELIKFDPILTYVIFVIYNVFFLSTWSSTPGKSLFGLRVVIKDNYFPLTASLSIKRSLLQIVSTLFFGVGYWNMGGDSSKQAFHDKKTGTVVLQRKKNLIVPIIIGVGCAVVWLYIRYYSQSSG